MTLPLYGCLGGSTTTSLLTQYVLWNVWNVWNTEDPTGNQPGETSYACLGADQSFAEVGINASHNAILVIYESHPGAH